MLFFKLIFSFSLDDIKQLKEHNIKALHKEDLFMAEHLKNHGFKVQIPSNW